MMKVLDSGNYYWQDGKQFPFMHLPELVPIYGNVPGLLDGKGGRLPQGAEPVWLEISEDDLKHGMAKNSAGETFTTPETDLTITIHDKPPVGAFNQIGATHDS